MLDLAPFTRLDGWISLLTLTALEVVLGIDNIVFLSIMTGKLPPERQPLARRIGLGLALVMRVLPDDARQRARARQLMAWFRSDLGAIRAERSTYHVFYGPSTTPLSPRAQAAARTLLAAAEALLPANAATLFGRFSVADSDLSLMLNRLARSGYPIGPRLQAYVDAIWARPSVRAFTERERAPYVAY